MSGLRERIEALAKRWDATGGVLGSVGSADLRDLLAADTTPAGDTETVERDDSLAMALGDPELREFVIPWLYNGPQGHRGEPPPRSLLPDLECDAANAIEAVTEWLAAAGLLATQDPT